MFTDRKLIIAGDFVHFYQYSKTIAYDYPKRPTPYSITTTDSEKLSSDKKGRTKSNIYRAKKFVKMLLQANSWQYRNKLGTRIPPQFYTFTFAENITDLITANKFFKQFIQKLNYHAKKTNYTQKILYLCVPEFQKRGAVHYHTIFFNLPFKKTIFNNIQHIWGYGFIFVKKVKNIFQLSSYISKYITAENDDSRIVGKKSYFASKGLYKPLTIKNPSSVDFIVPYLGTPSYTSNFESNGLNTQYSCFHQSVDNRIYKIAITANIEL